MVFVSPNSPVKILLKDTQFLSSELWSTVFLNTEFQRSLSHKTQFILIVGYQSYLFVCLVDLSLVTS